MIKNIKYIFFTLLVVLFDRLVKFLVSGVNLYDFGLIKIQSPQLNTQLSLSLPVNNNFSIVISIIGIIFVFILLFQTTKSFRYFYLAIIGAAFSNLFDRFAYGGVIDYINIFNLSIVNLADIIIFCCAITLAFKLVKIDSK